mmetsp:Transcript_20354/g.33566  ORF Transcript_20354/g.33566 Transcript_20354/m.33566 type:complete len:91 (-) Transcript_20354:522-794(-)
MDVSYPLSPLQAFAICLSSFDSKLAVSTFCTLGVLHVYSNHCLMIVRITLLNTIFIFLQSCPFSQSAVISVKYSFPITLACFRTKKDICL